MPSMALDIADVENGIDWIERYDHADGKMTA